MRKNNRTGFDMEVEFTHPETGETETSYVDIPFTIFIESLREFCEIRKEVVLDGTDTDVWNLFADIDGALEHFVDDEDFIEMCKEKYMNSYEYEEDFDDWKDDYDFEHDIGEYAPKDDED